MPTVTTRLGLAQPVTSDPVSEYRQSITQNAQVLDQAAVDLQGTQASMPAAGVTGRYFWATDTQTLFRDDGTVWHQLTAVCNQAHSFTVDDHTGVNPQASIVGSWVAVPAQGETISLVGAAIHCVTPGATPSTFAVQTDHGQHGTLQTVSGLSALAPTSTQQYVPAASPVALVLADRVALLATNPQAGTSTGWTVTVITQHLL
jgi:hypothetical protein